VDTVSILIWAVAIAGGLFAAYLVLHYALFLLMASAYPKPVMTLIAARRAACRAAISPTSERKTTSRGE
jgi:hypothetical protein